MRKLQRLDGPTERETERQEGQYKEIPLAFERDEGSSEREGWCLWGRYDPFNPIW